MASVYFDACCFIYLVEGAPTWRALVNERLLRLPPETTILTSQLSRLETRSKPLRDRSLTLFEQYDSLFAARNVSVVDISTTIIDRATDLRARYGFKSPDAIHLATAIDHRADMFLTADESLVKCADVAVEVLSARTTG